MEKGLLAVVTGANKGIGFEIAALLAKDPRVGQIVITSRCPARAEEAVQRLRQENPGECEFLGASLDLMSEKSVLSLRDFVESKLSSLLVA